MLRLSTVSAPLAEDGLVLALGAVVAVEAVADAITVVAETSAGAIAAGFIAVSLENIRTRGAFVKGAVRTSASKVTDAANLLLSVPGSSVGARRLGS